MIPIREIQLKTAISDMIYANTFFTSGRATPIHLYIHRYPCVLVNNLIAQIKQL